MPATFLRKRVVPSRPCSLENFAVAVAAVTNGASSSRPSKDQVPELRKSGFFPVAGTPATAEAVSWLPQRTTSIWPGEPSSPRRCPAMVQGSLTDGRMAGGMPSREASSVSHSAVPALSNPEVLAMVRSTVRSPLSQ